MGEQGNRLRQMLELAQVARGWNRTQLADALGRDPSRLVPASGNPKLDTIVRLSRILEWPIGDVVESLYDSTSDTMDLFIGTTVDETIEARMEGLDAEGLYQLAIELHGSGKLHECLIVARRLRVLTDVQELMAISYSIETVCWMDLGRYTHAVESCNAGLDRTDGPSWIKRNLRVNLATCLYLLWKLDLALATSDLMVRRISKTSPATPAELSPQVAALLLRGNVHRRLIQRDPENRTEHIEESTNDLNQVLDLVTDAPAEWQGTSFEARRLHAEYALLEVHVAASRLDATTAIDQILNSLTGYEDVAGSDHQVLDAIGWGCIYGCNLVLRELAGADQSQAFGILSNKALEIASELGNWAFRERIYSLQCVLQAKVPSSGFVLDDEDRAEIVAVMSRFPDFVQQGWSLLDFVHPKFGRGELR